MIGMILIAHAHIASEMRRAVEHVLGAQTQFEAIDVLDSNDVELIRSQLLIAVKRCDSGAGVIVFADLFGGTPCNIALAQMQQGQGEIISGFNLPMLIKTASKRKQEQTLRQLAQMIEVAGKQYVRLASGTDVEELSI
ncbi:MAG: PTS system fructose subfamily IIA component [Zetaproteobacteria bacterium CG_4_9_14_3_um_filter_49_83]|nr:MAG: hypothetical protein AUJ56_10785 [Zetaproteobacteria bacterium CG1_02_49_23]PIQ34947.1 MAG: PTS system fructose subfamily IIA component [Zetaproteobacteria bacterium CG17_big_fil_post_rev_8_21_14_2_50_50_13]PIV31446.1 MAG: PTS system fructose subfamily IIA component [Zetaproteobacteria bacterium CG02_land_8_20_14_3_00_50_9]PIY55031.1 MAG: PTS system fructose subfamily IIA component [Zetaproteobacteria bacterium CG_4_10_14_0_8_um_filter_49_80]PJA36518.1 MAG: PTS system fructose subfamily